MAEPRATAPSGVAASEPDVLLATKLHVPRLQPGFVPRPRLAEALSEGLAYRLILVCAPAGGAARQSCWPTRPGAASGTWPGCRWMLVTTTRCGSGGTWLQRARQGIAERGGPLLGPPAPSVFEGLVTALINKLAAQPSEDEVLLVIDDYQLIGVPQVRASLEFLVDHLPPGLHLVLASRSDPPTTCASPQTRRRRCFAKRLAVSCPVRRWRRWRPAPKGGPRACS